MKLNNYLTDKTALIDELKKRLSDIEQRERVILSMPFANKHLNRIEFYCSESSTKDTAGSMFFGEKFDGTFTISVFSDYGNKPLSKSSYSYKKEFFNYLPTLIDKVFQTIDK